MQSIKNLVFKGGGVLGVAYAGAFNVLEDKNILKNIEGVAGTSAGAIAALSVTLGYSSDEIKKILFNIKFKKFQDKMTVIDFPRKYGIYKGDYILTWIKEIIQTKTGNAEVTFTDLYNDSHIDLKVFACDLNQASPQEFSKSETPNVKVAEAIRASMSIPFLFHAWKFPDGNPNDHIFVDGGVMYNFPMTAFENSENTLGFFIKTVDDHVDLNYNQITTFAHRIFKSMLYGQDVDFLDRQGNGKNVVYIENMGIESNNFRINEDDKNQLYDAGRNATIKYLSNH